MAQGNYYYSTDYIYNIFDADEHLRVTLWKQGKSKYKWAGGWTFSTFLSSNFAQSRAERRIMKLRKVYGAEPIPK